ncbi:Protein ASPARTIC PROTEASE IN GUARD CELL 1 [Platanthera guangdongensis]|uniref:Protein ASPARTIC PROTEASE IN GUARD CELL 1 n=1 Tax=Platanthera guangdongensis TaxID=2320717 RepID=A0ABR2ML49_9ASPA
MALPYASLLLLLLCFFQSHYTAAASSSPNQPLLIHLSHTSSHSASPTFPSQTHLLKSSSLRSTSRFLSRHRGQQLSLPLAAGSDYTLSLSISSTTLPLSSPPPPTPPSSNPLPCSSLLCSAAHSSLPSSDLCAASHCPLDAIETSSCSPSSSPCPLLYYAYADGSLLASLRRGSLSLPGLSLPNFTFACAHSALAEPVGVAGFGRGALSLPTQLAKLSPFLASRFSYCLMSHSFLSHRLRRPSPLILGRSSSSSFTYTPLLRNPINHFFYSVALLSLSVGHVTLQASPKLSAVDKYGAGGMVVDSGTTFTMLPGDTHRRLTAEFRRQMERRGFVGASGVEERTGLGPCYEYGNKSKDRLRVPALGLHFAGNATMWLPTRNYFLGFESEGERVGCLMLMSAGDEEWEKDDAGGGPAGTLGNFQQQGMEVVYDVEMGRVGFARRRCGELWDSVSRG